MKYNISSLDPFGLLYQPKQLFADLNILDIAQLRANVLNKHLIILRGFTTFQKAEEFVLFGEKFGEISVWPFGKVLELIQHDHPEDHIFDNNYVPLHWDGMYRPEIPELQIFHCVKAPLTGQGGKTTFSNTRIVLQHASAELLKMWEDVIGIYQRKMEFYHSRTISPIIMPHPYKKFDVIRYNEPPSENQGVFLNPPHLEFKGISSTELDRFHSDLRKALYAPRNYYAHEWQTGDIILADNFSLLHGRENFVTKSPRHLQRIHILSDPPYKNPSLESYQ